jgi:hypothetical protein
MTSSPEYVILNDAKDLVFHIEASLSPNNEILRRFAHQNDIKRILFLMSSLCYRELSFTNKLLPPPKKRIHGVTTAQWMSMGGQMDPDTK